MIDCRACWSRHVRKSCASSRSACPCESQDRGRSLLNIERTSSDQVCWVRHRASPQRSATADAARKGLCFMNYDALRILRPALRRVVLVTALSASFGCGEGGDGPSAPSRPSTAPPPTESLVGKSPPGLAGKTGTTKKGAGGGGIKGNAANSSL